MRLSRAGKLLVPGWNCCWGEIFARSVPGVKCGRVSDGCKGKFGHSGTKPSVTGGVCKLQDKVSNP